MEVKSNIHMHIACIPDNVYLKQYTITRKSEYQKCKDVVTWAFPVFLFPHKHADIQVHSNFTQRIEAYEGHSPVVKAARMLYNATISQGQRGGGVL